MAKSKKRKKNTPTRKNPMMQKLFPSKSQTEAAVCTIKKVLRVVGIPPEHFDRFTRKQQQELTLQLCGAPRIVGDKASKVPSVFVKEIQQHLYYDLNSSYVGDPGINLTMYEYMGVGLSFITHVNNAKPLPPYSTNFDLIEEMKEAIDKCDEIHDYVEAISSIMQFCARYISKINFRYYTFDITWKVIEHRSEIVYYITLYSYEAIQKYFYPFGELRSAYKLGFILDNQRKPDWITVPRNMLMGGSDTTPLTVYVQPHALTRMRERLDIFDRIFYNDLLVYSMKNAVSVRAGNGQRLIPFLGMHKELDTKKRIVIGYLPFVIEGGSLFLLSFLPLTTAICPEGNKLAKILGITKEESSYLGMDRLSFYHGTDFDKIPRLKQALIDSDMWHLTELHYFNPELMPEKKTSEQLLKFFAEKEETSAHVDSDTNEAAES